ncbi:zinc fingers and homeoboxes protein 3 [Hemicordylus capensis]|uniref:zinc fingers and homeoboxes protein 3 n=1 Tax=Hemicordylus capensis TaxID=884348 RepID=UPI0023032191|nr:zinc fingers and homeoboxes protein 3 [Hemicordylus capensis]XP_053106980.1 zinc fingers and homeoboxes protein 3 [Hemicordylus capensis]XP_053106981.1 zinc fingers and homeoboxes protein 3 [Hemicordylus capensis]XP_053106982.1 zinc fingers and homeoboxes protein 3 [Hemicordylus capensis]XP_053106983.1 zinc fingers and homeoboxes protein 3 [Hemicordylus capensis]XP_053106984.1 zinc fingers and homeoboxes protein 3 [Hemicordylus capensis]XP_053106985.1 zinc fingers and homeoboxes protein 3 
MASKRKSTTPCMIPPKTLALQHMPSASEGADHEEVQPSGTPITLPTSDNVVNSNHNSATLSNGHSGIVDGDTYRCKFCSFGSQDVNHFLGHLDSEHRDFSKDPSFVCVQCSFLAKSHKVLSHHNAERHAEEASFIWNVVKQGNHMIVEQTNGDPTACQDLLGDLPEEGQDGQAEIIITKTPIMKIMKTKPEVKKIHMLKENASSKLASDLEKKGGEQPFTNGPVPVSQSTNSTVKSAHVVNGSIIGNMPVLQAGITQLVQLQQQPQVHPQLPTSKSLPKVMIPLSSIPTYNAAMDSNSFLKNSFHKFPYPTKAELCYLTVVTKYPEEQLKIWFTAQRLKQGISWSPEEIEDARKKMFNTVIQSVPQSTITVLNTPLVTSPGNVQHLIQASLPGHSVGKPEGASGVLVTQPIIANGLQGTTSSLAIAVTSIPKTQIAKPPTSVSLSSTASTLKVVSTAQSQLTACPNLSSQFLDPNIYKNKKSYEQLSALKNSFCRNQFPGHAEVERLTKITGLSTRDVRKWFSDRRYHCRNIRGSKVMQPGDNTIIIDSVPEITFTSSPKTATELISASAAAPVVHTPTRRQSWHQTPDFSATKYKERAPEQVKALESSFAQNPLPPSEEVDRLRSETKMTRREIDSWFSERRKRQAIRESEPQADDHVEDDSVEEDSSSDDLRASSENGSLDAASSNQLSGERKVTPIKINLKNFKVTESNGKSQLPGMSADGQRESSPSRPPMPQKPKLSFKKTAQQRHLLKQLFVHTQRPTNEQYDQICSQTGLPRAEVIRWFGDSRYGLKNGNLRWFENYKHGIFPKGLVISGEAGREVLQDYFQKNKMLYEDDLPALCEKTQMTIPQVRLWFAERLDEENRAISDTGSEDQSSSIGEPPSSQKGMYDAFSEVSENSESWEPGGQDGSSELGDADSNLPAVNFETD